VTAGTYGWQRGGVRRLQPCRPPVAAFCESQVSDDVKAELRLEHAVRGNSITIIERPAPWNDSGGPNWTSLKIAQLRYDDRRGRWTLYACDRNERWFAYDDAAPAAEVGPLLVETADDPTGDHSRSRGRTTPTSSAVPGSIRCQLGPGNASVTSAAVGYFASSPCSSTAG
jgi:Protein of unknown function (DUF3024)